MKIRTLQNRSVALVLILFAIHCRCTQKLPEDKTAEILELHQKLIAAHFDKNLDFFTQGISEKFISVKNGEILRPSLQEISTQVQDYLSHATFSEYRDLQKPIIGFSKDGSLAWAIVQVKVKGDRRLDDGTVRKIDFVCAWLTLYEKTAHGWDVLAEVSTFR